ncbi:nucleobase:cation symporter-2 family protein [Crenobacter sp. SG2305]|uniref:nucleobase:cation symporter-2 family protein n=1 Tax=Crenobacter oryzisoli TaxID=3056844 RepID=UPI0025AB3EBE|nr:nucleobase:cation symporter-2 family protein [Crenobacter sp. SG2305]MDN0085067.1 nucleobase:cation symporter-2 family protein [Crenobacter sp. SG2305]
MSNATEVHAVDEVLPWSRMIPVSLQHVLVMYAGAIAVPLIVGSAFKLPPTQLAFLVNADLFSCGVVTLIQCIGFWKFGIRLPVIMGVTFAAVGPMVAMANAGQGLLTIYGAVISSGVFGILIAPVFGRLIRFFPPLVTGTVITVIGVSLLEVGVNWAGGGFGAKDFGAPQNLMIVAIVLAAILLINKLTTGFLANIAVLSGLVIGYVVAVLLGLVSFADIDKAQWFGLVLPFRFGLPQFEIGSIVSFCLVMIVTLTESTGMFLALGEVCNRPIDHVSLVRGLRTDGLGTVIGGLFNTFPYTSFSQNVGLVGMTGIRSRWAVAGSGVILIVFGLFPKMGAIVASIPQAVLGGAGLCMFGMVAATGIKILQRVDFEHRANLLTVAVSLGMGVIPMVAPTFFHALPRWTASFTHSGITLAALTAVLLNALFNHVGSTAEVEHELAKSAHDAGSE